MQSTTLYDQMSNEYKDPSMMQSTTQKGYKTRTCIFLLALHKVFRVQLWLNLSRNMVQYNTRTYY